MELDNGGVGRGEAASHCSTASVCGATSSLELWVLSACWQVEATTGCWLSTLAVGVVVFWEKLSRFWPRLAWTLLWALSRGLGLGRPLTDSSRSTTSSRVQAWAAGRSAESRGRGQRWNKAKGGHLPTWPKTSGSSHEAVPRGMPRPSQLLTIAGQEHSPVHQVFQGLPEQLARAARRLQVHEALQH